MRDPHRAVAGRAQDGAVALREHGAGGRGRGAQRGIAFRMRIEEAHVEAEHHVGDAGHAVGRADLAQHGRGVVGVPGDRAVRLLHERPRAAACLRESAQRRRLLAAPDLRERGEQRTHGGGRDLAAIQAALGGVAHRERHARPHVARVELAVGLEHGDAPLALAVHHRPVERRGAAIADDARVYDEAAHTPPHGLRNAALEERRDDEIGLPQRDRFLRHAVGDVELDGDVVPRGNELAVTALREAVEGMAEQEDLHVGAAISRSSAAARR